MAKHFILLFVLVSLAAVQGLRGGGLRPGRLGHRGSNLLAAGSLIGLGYGLGSGGFGGYSHPPVGLYATPLIHGTPYGLGYGYGHGYGYGARPRGFHLGYEVGYQGKLGYVKLKRDNLRHVQVAVGLGQEQTPYLG